jgi:hypothetical protein
MDKTGAERAGEQPTTPKDFAATTPQPTGTDISSWVLAAVTRNTETLGKVEGTLVGLQAQMNRVESKIDTITTEVAGHGRWVHTVKYVLSGLGIFLAWLVAYVVAPWIKTKLFPGL